MCLKDKIYNRTAIIGVVGLGYVGLPLAIAFAEAGFKVIGVDSDQNKLESICRCESYIGDISDDRLEAVVSTAMLRVSTPIQDSKADIFIICVPTPVNDDKKPDLSYITVSAKQIKGRLASQDSMVVLESSTYPGTTRDLVLPVLERLARYVAYSPERVDPGSKGYNLNNTPKLVSGVDKESTELATLLYEQIVDRVVPVASLEVAETAKLYENVFRNVNIALANEMALICEKIGVSVWEVIDAAATKPFGFMPFYPGVGVGGHCIPVDPYYLVDKAKGQGYRPTLTETALTVNERQPNQIKHWIVDILIGLFGIIWDKKVMVLGATFKRDVSDTRESPSVELIKRLMRQHLIVSYNDPYVPEVQIGTKTLVSEPLDLIGDADCVVIATDHSCYDWKWIVDKAKLIFDTRNATKGIVSDKIYRLGERRD